MDVFSERGCDHSKYIETWTEDGCYAVHEGVDVSKLLDFEFLSLPAPYVDGISCKESILMISLLQRVGSGREGSSQVIVMAQRNMEDAIDCGISLG